MHFLFLTFSTTLSVVLLFFHFNIMKLRLKGYNLSKILQLIGNSWSLDTLGIVTMHCGFNDCAMIKKKKKLHLTLCVVNSSVRKIKLSVYSLICACWNRFQITLISPSLLRALIQRLVSGRHVLKKKVMRGD